MPLTRRAQQRGFTILEMIIVLIVIVSLLSLGAAYMKNSADERLNKSAAYDLQRITQAAQAWVKDNYSALSQNASSLTPEELKNNHYLPETFPVKNSYGQQYKLQVTPEKSGKNTFVRVTVITHDGMAISISDMRKIAGNMGENSGYSQQNGVITGNQNGWSLPYSEIKRGRVASVSYIAENDVVSAGAFLRRSKIDGHPEWNQMETDLGMKDNNITFEKGAIVFNHDGFESTLSADGASFAHNKQKVEITPDAVKLSDGSPNTFGSAITAQAVKMGVTMVDNPSLAHQKADEICAKSDDAAAGKTFMLGYRDPYNRYKPEFYTFICADNDGYSKVSGGGRAYFVNSTKINSYNSCDVYFWRAEDFRSSNPTDIATPCLAYRTGDGRFSVYDRLKFVKQIEGHSFFTTKGTCAYNAATRKANVCAIERITKEQLTPGVDQPAPDNDSQCNAATRGEGVRVIYIMTSSIDNPDSCGRIKYHHD